MRFNVQSMYLYFQCHSATCYFKKKTIIVIAKVLNLNSLVLVMVAFNIKSEIEDLGKKRIFLKTETFAFQKNFSKCPCSSSEFDMFPCIAHYVDSRTIFLRVLY